MSDLIRREDAIKAVKSVSENYTGKGKRDYHPHIDFIVDELKHAVPSAGRPQGKWVRTAGEYIGDDVSGFYDYHWACSECEKEAIINDWNIYELSDYCPHCGAYMKGADDE